MKTDIIKIIGTMNPNSSQRRIIYDKNFLSPTLQAAMGEGGGQVPMIIVTEGVKDERSLCTEVSKK